MRTTAIAPGKIILLGEHAVVYGQPAIAVPLLQQRAVATVTDADGAAVRLLLPDIERSYRLPPAPHPEDADAPFVAAVRLVQQTLGVANLPALTITIRSELPIASGLGSGAATAAALIRALWNHLTTDSLISAETLNRLTYEIEKLHHGTPSGIDNTVIAYEQPVYFQRSDSGNHIERFHIGGQMQLVVADTGVRSQTKEVVGDVRRRWQLDPPHFETLFAACGQLARAARQALETGDAVALGRLMRDNHAVLQAMTVSSAELDHLVDTAHAAGALGAKLSGAGRGGNMIALVDGDSAETVAAALQAAGAVHTIHTTLSAPAP